MPDAPDGALHDEWVRWRTSGLEQGINLDLEIAAALARGVAESLPAGSSDPAIWERRGRWRNCFAIAHSDRGTRESGTARLEEAVAAYRSALRERTRCRVASDWAGTQNNFGNALAALGERETGTARLKEEVEAYRAALLERTRERAPLEWAITSFNWAEAELALAARSEPARARALREAARARVAEAIAVFRESGASQYLAQAEALLAQIEAALRG